ncbi:MAG: hypothetical protein CMJ62_18025 [Planctomycetaceae bacterium]|nr:hypothetical protein [Planctomycetaceae bacterium]
MFGKSFCPEGAAACSRGMSKAIPPIKALQINFLEEDAATIAQPPREPGYRGKNPVTKPNVTQTKSVDYET